METYTTRTLTVEYHISRGNGMFGIYFGDLTTDHAMSNYGQPVMVVNTASHTDMPLRGAFGAGELPAGTLVAAAACTRDDIALLTRAAEAGYVVDTSSVNADCP